MNFVITAKQAAEASETNKSVRVEFEKDRAMKKIGEQTRADDGGRSVDVECYYPEAVAVYLRSNGYKVSVYGRTISVSW
jgi:hypothetical protein